MDEKKHERHFAVFDELYSGTNPYEAISSAYSYLNYISKNKGGFIIHLEQEGRGIGLVNKIKAYKLQDQGMNTYTADSSMGFLEEERDFTIAAIILKDLGVKKVNLITNNHQKIKILKNNKIIINKQIPTYPIINKFNFDYLSSKVNKSKYKILVK